MSVPESTSSAAGPGSPPGDSTVWAWRRHEKHSPPCECSECSQQYRSNKAQTDQRYRYAAIRSSVDAETLLREGVQSITDNQEFLREVLMKHGNTILSRWKKKSAAKRVECLLATFPKIEENKRPHFEYMYDLRQPRNESEYRNAFLLPYLSLQDLKIDPMRFLSLLHYRAKHTADEWFSFDVGQTKAGWDTSRFALEYCASCVVMHGPEYGSVVPWNETEAHRWDIVGFPRAQLVIEGQKVLMEFLRKTVEHLLQGVEIESLSTKWTEVYTSGFRKSREDEIWSTLINQAYTAPPSFNVDRLLDVSRARLGSAEDHLWLLQTDPPYMHATIAYHRHSRIGTFLRTKSEEKNVYGYVGNTLVIAPLQKVQDWHYIVEECKNLEEMSQTFGDDVKIGQPLPLKYSEALGCLEYLLTRMLRTRRKELKALLPKLRGFEDCFGSMRLQHDSLETQLLRDRTGSQWYEKDTLFWCLMQMCDEPKDGLDLDLGMLFGFFDDLMDQGSRISVDVTRIDQLMMDELSDFGAILELLVIVGSHRPVSRALSRSEAYDVGRPRMVWRKWEAEEMHGPDTSHENKHFISLLQSFDDVRMPSGKHDLAWLEKARNVRELLKAYWDNVRGYHRHHYERIQFSQEDIERTLSLWSFDLAAEHLEELQNEEEAILAPAETKAASRAPLTEADPQTAWTPESSTTTTPALPIKGKEKVKTRGQPSEAADVDPELADDPEPDPPPPLPQIAVREESLRIFQAMYPPERKQGEKKEAGGKALNWAKFVGAMADAGLAASQSGGSAVTFSSGSGRIIFHKPHPVAKIDPVMLVDHGRRLHKWFGWKRETFVTADE